MLIQALCNYYDILSAEGKVLPEGYSKVKIHYLISLTEEGTIDNIINVQREIAESKKENVFFLIYSLSRDNVCKSLVILELD